MKLGKLFIPRNVQLMVFDMAGTTVNEGGLVYKTLYNTIKNFGLSIEEEEIKDWHGSNKYEVMDYFYTNRGLGHGLKTDLFNQFDNNLLYEYNKEGNLELIDQEMPNLFNTFRKERNIKIALNTGYSRDLQETIVDSLGMRDFVDDFISSEDVKYGRPSPYMILELMNRNGVRNVENVVKIGDTPNDILEGLNAKCLMNVGVLSGTSDEETLVEAGASRVIDSVMNIDTDAYPVGKNI